MAVDVGDLAGQHRAGRTVGVVDLHLDLHGRAAVERSLRALDQLLVEHAFQMMVLLLGVIDLLTLLLLLLHEQFREIETLGLPVRDEPRLVEHLGLADHLVEAAVAERSHDLADFLGDEEEVVDDVLGLAGEALAQHRVLRGDADRAGVEMALAHHDAARRDQGRGGEAELVGPEQRADHDVASGAEAAVDLHRDAAAQPLAHQRLVGFGKPDLPGRAGMLDRGQRRSAGAALEARDGDMVGARLGDARRDRADADLGDELDRDLAVGIDVLQVVDQLREVLDRIDVVMRRRRDQADARRRAPHARDRRVDLVAGQLSAFAGLGALRHLDLHHVGVDEIFRRHAEAARGDLLDRRAHGVAVRQRLEAVGFLAAFAGVGLAADPVHGDRKRRVRLARDRAEAHRAGREALDDVLGRLDLVEGDRLALVVLGALDPEQAAQGQEPLGLLVEDFCKAAIALDRIAAHRVLQVGDGLRRPGVILAAGAVGIFAADVERGLVDQRIAERIGMAPRGLFRDLGETDALDAGVGAGEIFGDEIGLQPDGVENLRAAIGLIGRDAHLRHHLEQALADRLDVALDDLVVAERARQPVLQRDDGLEGQIRD